MGRRCIVAGCSKTTKDGVSLHKFPVDTKVRRQWITQVKKNRANWREPSSYSEVCSDHFTRDSFEFARDIGIQMKNILKPDIIPTIFPKPSSSTSKVKRVSTAFKIREKARVSIYIVVVSLYNFCRC